MSFPVLASTGETGWMSSVETGQMSAAETGQMSAFERRQISSVARADICVAKVHRLIPPAYVTALLLRSVSTGAARAQPHFLILLVLRTLWNGSGMLRVQFSSRTINCAHDYF